jgi:hypothetical protein
VPAVGVNAYVGHTIRMTYAGHRATEGAKAKVNCQQKLKAYLACKRLEQSHKDTNDDVILHCPLIWWSEHAKLYPNLAVLARQWLCIPATSAPSERVFSHMGKTITAERASLLPANAEVLVFLHDVWPVVLEYERAKRARHVHPSEI